MIDLREVKKNRLLNDMRKELKEIERIKRTPKGRKDLIYKYVSDNFGIDFNREEVSHE